MTNEVKKVLSMSEAELRDEYVKLLVDLKVKSSNTDCSRCSRCSDCTGCSDCYNCSNCSGCSGCSGCFDCTGCSICSNCFDCSDCSYCLNQANSKYMVLNTQLTRVEYLKWLRHHKVVQGD